MYSEIELNTAAAEKLFRSLKARSRVPMMDFKVNMTGASFVIVCKTHEFTIKLLFGFETLNVTNQHQCDAYIFWG